jgi:protein-S-isoprenylcysteine O-methyltransferase Ste14
MTSRPTQNRRATILVPIAVLMVVGAFMLAGYALCVLLRVPIVLGLPLSIRLVGAVVVMTGLAVFLWMFRYRSPYDVLTSTYLTFSKMARRVRLEENVGRTERLVVQGPYRLVRHPIYLAVLISLVGWGLLLDFSFILVAAVVALLWFDFVVMPYEEKELLALFGSDYEEYMKRVRRIVPIPRSSSNDEKP